MTEDQGICAVCVLLVRSPAEAASGAGGGGRLAVSSVHVRQCQGYAVCNVRRKLEIEEGRVRPARLANPSEQRRIPRPLSARIKATQAALSELSSCVKKHRYTRGSPIPVFAERAFSACPPRMPSQRYPS